MDFGRRSAARFDAFFLEGRPLRADRAERGWFGRFLAAGLAVRRAETLFEPCARVFLFDGHLVATDLPTHLDADQVFPLMREQEHVAAHTSAAEGDEVLELCTGSGALALAAASRGARVTAVDVSERAIAFARVNLALNRRADAVELLRGSLFSPLAPGRMFDLVLVNPPFEPVPPGAEHFLHSAGGEDGLDLVREILAAAPARLRPGGRFEIVTFSLGTEEGPRLLDLLREAFPGGRITMDTLANEPLEDYVREWRGRGDHRGWRERLAAAGHTRLWFVFARVATARPPRAAP